MTHTILLLQIIGSPFCKSERCLPDSVSIAKDLYKFAVKNKIGLLYLTSLNERKKLEEYSLETEYIYEMEMHNDQIKTLCRITHLFNTNKINYAVFKSHMPFPATPNDIDIIHFGSDNEFIKIGDLMLASGYQEVIGTADTQQRMFHDTIIGGVSDPHPKKKDVFDVDFYQKVSASHLIYLDKTKLKEHVIDFYLGDSKIKFLSPEAELMAIIIHSIFPELMSTLFVYYSTLYYVDKMNDESILNFVSLIKENFVMEAARAHFSLVAELHKVAHGFVPDKIDRLCGLLGTEEHEKRSLRDTKFNTPHKYGICCFLKVIAEKCHDKEFKRSIPEQILFSLRPRNLRWIVYNIVWRYQRETY